MSRNGSRVHVPLQKKLRIALVNLRALINEWHHIRMVPLGLLYISAAAKHAYGDRIEVRLFDLAVCGTPQPLKLKEALHAFLEESRPDLVGIRGFSSQAAEFLHVARAAKEVNPDCLVIAGGPHASTGSLDLFMAEDIDLVVRGEGEMTFVEIVGNLLEGRDHTATTGVGWLENGEPVRTPQQQPILDLDTLPFPDYSLIDLDQYQGEITMTDFLARTRFTSLFTSRGCPYRCTYCHTIFGKRLRTRSVQNVIAEMAELIETHEVREFHIVDDIFNADRTRAIAIFDEIARRGWNISIAFPNGLRGDRMDEEFISAARAAGTYQWALAVETASHRLQKQVQKFNKLDRLRDTIALSDRYGVVTTTFNMLGFPTETEDEMRATIDFNAESAAHIAHFFVVTPYEGTRLHDELVLRPREHGVPPDPCSQGYMDFSSTDGHDSLCAVPRSRIAVLVREAVRRFYFDGPTRLTRMGELSAWQHNPASLAQFIHRRLQAAGLSVSTVTAPVRTVLTDLFTRAKAAEPELFSHLLGPLSEWTAV